MRRRPSARELAREQAVLINGDYNAVMRGLEDYNPSVSQSPPGDLVEQNGELHVVLDPPWRRKRGESDKRWRARVEALRRQRSRAPQFVWVDHAPDELRPAGGSFRLERMIDAPGPHGLRRGRLAGPTRRKRKREPVTAYRARLEAVFHQAWQDAGLSQIHDWRELERTPPQRVLFRGVKRLEAIAAPSDEDVRKWVAEVTSADEKSTLAQHIAYRLVGFRWDLPPDWVKSKIRDAKKTGF